MSSLKLGLEVASIVLILIMIVSLLPIAHAGTYGGRYTEFQYKDLRVIVYENIYNPDYVINYKGINYISLNAVGKFMFSDLEAIPNIKPAKNVGVLTQEEVYSTLSPLKNSLTISFISISKRYGGVEIVVGPNVNLTKASRILAETLEPLLVSKGYHTLMIVRLFSNASPNELVGAMYAYSNLIYSAISNPGKYKNVPSYLLQIAKLVNASLHKYPIEMHVLVGVGVYGSVGIDFWGPQPTKKQVYELVKWLRNNAGYSDIPLTITFHKDPPPKEYLLIGHATESSKKVINRMDLISPAILILISTLTLVVATTYTWLRKH